MHGRDGEVRAWDFRRSSASSRRSLPGAAVCSPRPAGHASRCSGRPFGRVAVRYSVRALMILVLVVGGGLGWLVRCAHSQRDAVSAVRRAGGTAWYDWQLKESRPDPNFPRMWPTPERPRRHMMEAELKELSRLYAAPPASVMGWLADHGEVDYFGNVIQVSLNRLGSDEDVAAIGDLGRLEILDLSTSSVADAGLGSI